MSKLSELEGSQIFIFQTNYYTQKVSNKTCNQTKESHRLSFTLTFPSALFFTPLLYTSLLFFPPLLSFVVHLLAHIISRSSFCSPPLQDAVGPFPFLTFSLSSPLFWVFLFFSYAPRHFSLLSSAPSLESAVFRSSGLLHC